MPQTLLRAAALIVFLAAALGARQRQAESAAPFYVRTDGSDSICNGLAYASSAAAPNCAYRTINYAISAGTPDQPVYVGPGTYLPGQINFSQDIQLLGMPGPKPVLENTTGPGTWFICNPAASCNFSHLVFDANEQPNVIGLRYLGSGIIDDVDFERFSAGLVPSTAAIEAKGTVTVRNSTFVAVSVAVSVLAGSSSSISNSTFDSPAGVAIAVSAPDAVIDHNRIGAFVGVNVARATGAAPPAHATVLSNDFTDSHINVSVGRDIDDKSSLDAHFNRFGADGGINGSPKSGVEAQNNWWGCNSGPVIYPAPGPCAALVFIPIEKATPWLVMNVAPARSATNGDTTAAVDFRRNSNGDDVSAEGLLPDRVPVVLGSDPPDRGTIAPTALTLGGLAIASFAVGPADGLARITAQLDAQAVKTRITVDRVKPSTQISEPKGGAVLQTLTRVAGTATDQAPKSGIRAVQVSIRREVGRDCFFWNSARWVARACANRLWLPAAGTRRWDTSLPGGTAPFQVEGNYSVFSRAIDNAGNKVDRKFTLGKDWIRFKVIGDTP